MDTFKIIKNSRESGTTLMELLIYMALLAILLISILQASLFLTGDMQHRQKTAEQDLYILISKEKAKR